MKGTVQISYAEIILYITYPVDHDRVKNNKVRDDIKAVIAVLLTITYY